MATTVQELVAEREIKWLTHFTREPYLPSILQRGLITRDVMIKEGNEGLCNDQLRLDGTHAICASVSFPNYKMFWGLRKDHPDVNWIVLAIHPSALWSTRVAFCTANAASAGVSAIPLEQRMSLAAFEAMFADFGDKARAPLGLANAHPTNPQAEVLFLDGVPRQFIAGAWALNAEQKARIEAQHPGFQVVVNAALYRYRRDFEHWKSQA